VVILFPRFFSALFSSFVCNISTVFIGSKSE
jgi:hypothetical protein